MLGTQKNSSRKYIGDGVYVEFDGYSLILTTENGITVTNRIVLEPEVYRDLRLYVESLLPRVCLDCHVAMQPDGTLKHARGCAGVWAATGGR